MHKNGFKEKEARTLAVLYALNMFIINAWYPQRKSQYSLPDVVTTDDSPMYTNIHSPGFILCMFWQEVGNEQFLELVSWITGC